MSYITVEEYYKHTNSGLDIIVMLFPDAEKASRDKQFKFKIRDERSASSSLYLNPNKNAWYVTDFGDRSYSPIDLVMKELNVDFRGACRWIEQTFNISGKTFSEVTTKAKPEYRVRPATEDEVIGTRTWTYKEKPLMSDLKTLFSKHVWSHLQQGEDDEVAYINACKLIERYNLHVLESSSLVGKLKATGEKVVHTFSSTEGYPIYMFNEGSWQKFYEPFAKDAANRFASYGQKPKDYMFGKDRILRKFNEAQMMEDEQKRKLSEIIICTGGSDALNVAALGYEVVWFNSETVHPWSIPMHNLTFWAHRVYNLPDIDATGKKKAFELASYHLDLYTIYLPESLANLKTGKFDQDGKPKYSKDVRDYLNHYGEHDFSNLIKISYPLRFWNAAPALDAKGNPKYFEGKAILKYTPKPKLMLNFLHRNGFVQLKNNAGGTDFVRITNNIVTSIKANEMKEFIDGFLESRHAESDLIDAFIRSKDLTENTLERLPRWSLDFKDYDRFSQKLFFKNEVWTVSENKIETVKANKADTFVWEHEVIAPKYLDERAKEQAVDIEISDPYFRIEKNELGEYLIDVLKDDNPFFNFLINTSRVHWRTELEDRLDKSSEDKEQYRLVHKYDIKGPLLKEDEQKEQQLHLVAKMSAMGYLLHRYKDEANTYCIWSMDYIMRDSDKSQGGTGKSVFGKSFFNMMQYEVLDGRDKELTKNRHIFENVTEHTDYLLVDDGQKYLDFSFFFAVITTFMKVNPKGTKSFNLMFKDMPKIHISSNFPPVESDDSTLRRLWFLAFSDYYHYNASGEYREVRRPIDEFGKNLFQDFTKEEWIAFLNFAAQCIQVYLKFGKVEPPMKELMINTYKSKLGPNFIPWANLYFSEDNETLNAYVPRYKMFESYKMEVNVDITTNGFKDKVALYCRMKGWILNPKEAKHIQEDGRINIKCKTREVFDNKTKSWIETELPKPQSIEHFYIQSPETKISTKGLEEPEKQDLPF
ncbi:hypothetical protein VB264_05360 [Arcicella aquatica]|uniref:Uncharacterized protein n=1 Tax=Arcicella aquatica TaxID=217141 RepID=A0ABU5QJG9_9BACT|nr:primase-helicase family protein [Arcicella aquatica]MEA5257205.1 hypothetical protein [Arcicella aquatica]